MNIIDLIICLVSLAVYSVTFASVFFCLPGYKTRRSKVPCIIAGAVFIALTVLINFAVPKDDLYSVFDIILTVLSFVTPYLVFVAKKKLAFLGFGSVVMISFDYIKAFIFSIFPKLEFTDRREALICCAIYTVVLVLLLVFRKKIASRIPDGFIEGIHPVLYLVIFLAFFANVTKSMLGVDDVYDPALSKVLDSLSSGLIILAIIWLITRYFLASAKQKESEMQLEMELNHYEELIQKNKDLREFRHDYVNNLNGIRHLIEGNDIDGAVRFIDEKTGESEKAKIKYATGNYLADAIISEKAKAAEALGISIDFKGIIPPQGIKNSDLCTILSNTLDNAVRACESIAPCTIKIDSSDRRGGVIITVSNPVKEKVVIKNNSIKTTKSDKENHGIGIGNVKKTAEKYSGSVTLSCTDSEFSIEIALITD